MHYAPEKSGNAPYTTGLANGLARRGREPRVLTGYPHYPEWKRYQSYDGWAISEVLDGVSLKRLRHLIPSEPNAVTRLLMELSFGLRVIATKWSSPDIIVLVSPALLSTAIALMRARIARPRVPVIIWVQDIYSLGVTETGTAGSIVGRLLKALESLILRSADGVVVIHERFRSHLIGELHVNPRRVQVVRNWTHLNPFHVQDRQRCRSSFGWAPEDVIVLHAGNMGAKQGLHNVVQAARQADIRGSRVRFVLLGNGNQRSKLEEMAAGIERISFVDSLPGSRFQEALACADVLLVNELPGVKDMSVPSKLTSYFSTGVPVLAATDEQSVTAEEIRSARAGQLVAAGDPLALLTAAEELASNPSAGEQFASNALHFVQTNLSESFAVEQYDRYITQTFVRFRPNNR